jgi:serine/threonine protein kinase/tetratricopeptide (TPR) repeat protein
MASVLEQGSVFADRFAIEARVASGGMGTVYRARDRSSGERVALKLVHASEQNHEAERFAREARLLAELRHPNIVSYISHGEAPCGQLFLAMEWLDGEDLASRLRRGPLSVGDAHTLVASVASALASAHERGIVHRDLKPSNLFLADGRIERVIVLDFGIARSVGTLGGLTATGLLIGTPSYMAPEQARSSTDLTPAVDIFSLGCVVYEALTGRPPFEADHVAAVLARILFDAPLPVRRVRPGVPEAWESLIARMLDKDPEKRPQNAAALRAEVAELPLAQEADAVSERWTAPPETPWSGAEQSLVSVVLATRAAPSEPDERPFGVESGVRAAGDHRQDELRLKDAMTLDSAREPADRADISGIRRSIDRFGARLESLADGSLVATVIMKSGARDQAGAAARTALAVREHWGQARIAVTTGRGLMGKRVPVGEAVDRAFALLRRSQTANGGPLPPDGVRLDEATAGLLDARFTLLRFDGGAVLEGERVTLDEGRPLLGKPTPCVGREPELAQLESILQRCVEESIPQAVLLTAPAGMGKSRIRHELLRRVSGSMATALILFGRGDPLTAGSPYGFLSQALRLHARAGESDDPELQRRWLQENLCRRVASSDAGRVAEFLGELCGVPFPDESSPPLQAARSDPKAMNEQIEHAFLDWLGAECAAGPVLLVLEDVQWCDRLTVNLLEASLRAMEERPFFVLAAARPEVKELFPKLWDGYLHEIPVRPLSKKASARLVQGVLGERGAGPETVARIVDQAAGNALFLEELIRAAAEGKASEVPETVLAILHARLLRLPLPARRFLRAASIFGETFWLSAAQAICESSPTASDVASSIKLLTDAEIIEKHRNSRFLDETEYGFRHALVRDAAYGLLTDADRALGHCLAGAQLERMGETDAAVLAEHARRGGDLPMAIRFFARAAEQSLERNDLTEALARAARGVELGASGEALGFLRAVQSLASYGLATWEAAAGTGLEALDLLPPGSLWWCRVTEKLFNVLPTIGKLDRFQALVERFATIEPTREALSAYVGAAGFLIGVFGIVGVRPAVHLWLGLVEKVRPSLPDHDAYSRGMIALGHGYALRTLEPEPYLALAAAEESVLCFRQARHSPRLCLAMSLLGSCLSELGDLAGAEEAFRGALSLGREIQDVYSLADSQAYLGIALASFPSPERAPEMERLARAVLEVNVSLAYNGAARWVLATAHLVRGDFMEAEAEARLAQELFASSVPPYTLGISVLLSKILRGQGRIAEAAAVMVEALDTMEKLGGTGWSEVPVCVAAAEAFHAAGDTEGARDVLKRALKHIELRASRIPDPAVRERYLTQRPENARAVELSRAWLNAGA